MDQATLNGLIHFSYRSTNRGSSLLLEPILLKSQGDIKTIYPNAN